MGYCICIHILVNDIQCDVSIYITHAQSNSNDLFPCLEFKKANVDLSKPVVITCGGAVVAPLVALCAHLLGKEVAVYDVSSYQ